MLALQYLGVPSIYSIRGSAKVPPGAGHQATSLIAADQYLNGFP